MEMDDRFLHEQRREPSPGFGRRLRERLQEEEEEVHGRGRAWRSLAAVAASVAVGVVVFAFPGVRAGAQAVLDLFRVRTFVGVPFDAGRLETLRSLEENRGLLLFDRHEVIQDPGPPAVHSSAAAAAAAAGFAVGTPGFLPAGLALDTVLVTGEARSRFEVSTARLREMLAALDVRDVDVPADLDGRELTVHMYPVVAQKFRGERARLTLLQSRSPEVSLPSGVDLARLGEAGLRVLGLDAGEARRIASTVDWRNTLLVPVPVDASSFRQVTVQGRPGLLITSMRQDERGRRRSGAVVLWTEGDRVFALSGTLQGSDLMQVAESVR